MQENIKSLWHTTPGDSEVREGKAMTDGQVKIRSICSLISLGTELTVAKGETPGSTYGQMRVPHMEGSFSLPISYGYSLVGRIERAPDNALEGRIAHTMYPHHSTALVGPDEFSLVPTGVPPERATLASNMETAVNAVWDGRVQPGDKVLVIGFGLVGSLICRIASGIPGVRCRVLEINPVRAGHAQQMGFDIFTPEQEGPDIVFHCSGTSAGLQDAIRYARPEASIVEVSWYGSRSTQVFLGDRFHTERLRLISSQVSSIPAGKRNLWDAERRKALVFSLLEDTAYDLHLGPRLTLEETAEAFIKWRQSPPDALSYLITYEKAI